MDALDILYYDCWIDVFKKVEPEDLYNLSNVCQLFRKITNDSRYGFSEVEWKFDAILPQLLPYLGNRYQGATTLKSRLVCKSWLKSTDRILQERDFCPRLTFQTTERIEEFIERFENSPPSPILLRDVIFYPAHIQGNYLESGMRFVQRFGMDVWKLTLYRLTSVSLQFLPHTPNLKTLNYTSDREDEVGHVIHPLPNLPQLKSSQMCHLSEHEANEVNHILQKYGPQLDYLYYYGLMTTFVDLRLEANGINSQTFGALKTLDVRIEIGANTFAAFQSLDCPLETLKIYLMDFTNKKLFEIDLFLKSIQHLQQLKSLSIKANNKIRISETGWLSSEEFDNASIKNLKLKIDFWLSNGPKKANISFNFLESLAQLESLSLKYDLGGYWSEAKVSHVGTPKSVDLFDDISLKDIWNGKEPHLDKRHAYESNVWEEVESLEKIKLEISREPGSKHFLFTREEHNAYWIL